MSSTACASFWLSCVFIADTNGRSVAERKQRNLPLRHSRVFRRRRPKRCEICRSAAEWNKEELSGNTHVSIGAWGDRAASDADVRRAYWKCRAGKFNLVSPGFQNLLHWLPLCSVLQFGRIVPWLCMNHKHHSVLLHPYHNDKKLAGYDHTKYPLWLGKQLQINTAIFAHYNVPV